MEAEFVDFLMSRDIPQDSIDKLKEDKVNCVTVVIIIHEALS